MSHDHYMARAIELAGRGLYTVRGNPRVGCVIVKDNAIVGEGWHQYAGGAHAEVNALHQAGVSAHGATCYLSLEPCTHQGKTPPCTPALIQAGIKRVVIATLDPNPLVCGKGVKALRAAGIEVEIGVMADNAYALNPGFFMRMEHQRPYMRVKLGMSLDGRTALANGKSHWVTSVAARQDVQYKRAQTCAILTSSRTVLDDNPQLNVRDPDVIAEIAAVTSLPVVQPHRLVLDAHLRTLPSQQIYQLPGSVTVFTREDTVLSQAWLNAGIQIVPVPVAGGHMDFTVIMAWLAENQINEIMVEAGPRLVGALCQAQLVDEWVIYIAPKFLGPQARPLVQLPQYTELNQVSALRYVEYQQVGEDLKIVARSC